MGILLDKRKKAGLTAKEVSKLIGVTENAIYNYETNRNYVKASKLYEIYTKLNFTQEELILYLKEIYEDNLKKNNQVMWNKKS